MTVPPRSEQPVTDDERAFPASLPRGKGQKLGRPLPARGASPSQWAIRVGLTLLIAVLVVVLYVQWSGRSLWANTPTVATTTAQPNPTATASGEPAMSGGYQIGPDGVLVRPTEYAASTYTKPELPEEAKQNTERGAEAAAEHYLALLVYAWNTGDTQPFADMSDPASKFASDYINDVNEQYANGWSYGMESNITHVLRVEPIEANGKDIPEGSILVKFRTETNDGTSCKRTRLQAASSTYKSTVTFIMTWRDGEWTELQGRTVGDDED